MSCEKILKDVLKTLIHQIHRLGLRFNVAVLPNHYYTPVADIRNLSLTVESWATRSHLVGVEVDLDQQARLLREVCSPFEREYRGGAAFLEGSRNGAGLGFGYIEAQALHAVLRYLKPLRLIEVGSGVSTYVMIAATKQNENPTEISCIEPNPTRWLQNSGVKLLGIPVQQVPLSFFSSLGAGDFLFIDSSHAVKTASDTNFLILEVLPRLRSGVWVHFHDIFLPYDFPRDAIRGIFNWQETALLHAFLACNSRFKIVFCLSHLHYDKPDVLREVFPEYVPQPDSRGLSVAKAPGHFPSSIYLRVL
jgi:hypothetical protein